MIEISFPDGNNFYFNDLRSYVNLRKIQAWDPFLESPETFRAYSGDIIFFVSSKRRRLEARNFALTCIFIPFTTYEKTSFTE